MGLIMAYLDRKIYARLQNRQGPPWFQPFLADFLKLLGKETIVPELANKKAFPFLPVLALARCYYSVFIYPAMEHVFFIPL